VIGYYVHHHGRGHRQRAGVLANRLATPVTALSSAGPPEDWDPARPWIRLPGDELDVAPTGTGHPGTPGGDPTAGGVLHWAPPHHPGLRQRMAMIAAWIADAAPSLLVVDVSVEVALLGTLLGVPTVVVGMPGDRSDRPHRAAYDAAVAVLAPWAPEFADPAWPQSWRDKTFHAGAISRFAGRGIAERTTRPGRPRVLVLWGEGGAGRPDAAIARARAATPDWDWQSTQASDDVFARLAEVDVVITHAGQNAVAEVAAAGTPAIVVADDRPHGEQRATAARLQNSGIAAGLSGWPADRAWPELLTAARRRGGQGWTRWTAGDGAAAAAGFLDRLAADSARFGADSPARFGLPARDQDHSATAPGEPDPLQSMGLR